LDDGFGLIPRFTAIKKLEIVISKYPIFFFVEPHFHFFFINAQFRVYLKQFVMVIRMRKKDGMTIYFGDNKGRSSKALLWLIGIMGIVVVFLLWSGTSGRYQTGHVLRAMIMTLGSLSTLGGYLLIGFFFLSLLLKRFNVKLLVLGVLLLWIVSFLTGTPFTLFDYNFGEARPPVGYHLKYD